MPLLFFCVLRRRKKPAFLIALSWVKFCWQYFIILCCMWLNGIRESVNMNSILRFDSFYRAHTQLKLHFSCDRLDTLSLIAKVSKMNFFYFSFFYLSHFVLQNKVYKNFTICNSLLRLNLFESYFIVVENVRTWINWKHFVPPTKIASSAMVDNLPSFEHQLCGFFFLFPFLFSMRCNCAIILYNLKSQTASICIFFVLDV